MRGFYRWMRKGMATVFVLAVAGGIIYYLVFTLTGIADEISERSKLNDRDALLIETSTILAPTINAESLELARFDTTAVPTDEPASLETPSTDGEALAPTVEVAAAITDTATSVPTDTAIPTDEPSPTETETPVPTDTETPVPSDTPTDEPSPTDTDEPTEEPTEVAQLATLIPTNTARPTSIPTNTPRPTRTPSLTPSMTLTPSDTPTNTLTPTSTNTSTPSPTSTNTYTPTPTYTPSRTPTPSPSPYPIEGTYALPITTPIIPFPARAPLVENDPDIINIVLLGADSTGNTIGRTDVFILVSINKNARSVAMWHIPRDLLVYIPGNTVDRINRTYPIGALESDFPGGGPGLVKETILYNFGINVDFYARVNFTDFQAIIEKLGGLEISIDCQIEDWALISPDADPTLEESYERYTMRIGRQTLSPYYALWYARSRVTTSDLDRGRRQIDILRAIFNQARQTGLVTQATELYPELIQIVDTDMELTDMLGFVPLASNLELSSIARYNGVLGVHYENFTTPDDGRAVLLPNYEKIYELARDFVTPPTGNRLERTATTIEVYDASAYGIGFDLVASDRLAWEGFRALPAGQLSGVRKEVTTIYDYTGATKGSALERIMEVMRVGPSNVVVEPDPNRTVDFRIEVGTSYNSCLIGSSADEIEAGPPIQEEIDRLGTPTPAAEPQTVG